MKGYLFLLLFAMLFAACGGRMEQKSDSYDVVIERPDSQNIVDMAQIMARDLKKMLVKDDIQSAASLCLEAIDNMSYFKENGDITSARIYARHLMDFYKQNNDSLGDMATQNYVVKQFYVMIDNLCNEDSEETVDKTSKDKGTESHK